ncbi:head-tail connector protein [Aurantimonas sp. A3-2-R12]|uniref:head-tail connector protein n=1 Tax=Aurantimonas sp. A3-2-R12 TaxID=3114362 RepID=UPI002E19BB63|nr:head-tail connector protein [Aurantimonas sp. A3-2-R12]
MTMIDLGGGVEPMTAADIKIWARIDRADEDGLIANLIRAARETIEAIRLSPAVRMAAANGVEVEFEAGFAVGMVPENLLLALRTIVAASYELRAAVDPSQQPAVLPPLARSLLAPYRRVRI